MNLSEVIQSKVALKNMKANLSHRLNLLDRDKMRITIPVPESSDDQATANENNEIVSRLGKRDKVELKNVVEALKRIRKGVFGRCLTCGNEIEKKRLIAVPYAVNCIECENEND